MSHTIHIKKEDLPKKRSFIRLDAQTRNSAGSMRDKRDRRPKNVRNNWKNEEYD